MDHPMSINSKAWDWSQVTDRKWQEPSRESFYYRYRWQKFGWRIILDLGCGLGRHALFFAEKGFEVEAYDLSESGLSELNQVAMKHGLSIHTQLGDMRNLPYSDGYFQCIFAYHSIYHTDRAGISRTISELKRVLAPGGEIFLTFNSKKNPSFTKQPYQQIDENTIIKMDGLEKGIPHFYVDSSDLKQLLPDFEILKMQHVEELTDLTTTGCHYHVQLKLGESDQFAPMKDQF